MDTRSGYRNTSNRGTCSTCKYWSPHVHYQYIGLCRLHGTMTFDDYSCPSYTPLRPKENGRVFYWCATCKTRVTAEEAVEHIARGDKVYISAYVDPDVREEIYDAF